MARENKFLTQEVARLNAELRQKDNRLAQLIAQGGTARHDGGVGGSNHTGGAEYNSLGSATALRIELDSSRDEGRRLAAGQLKKKLPKHLQRQRTKLARHFKRLRNRFNRWWSK